MAAALLNGLMFNFSWLLIVSRGMFRAGAALLLAWPLALQAAGALPTREPDVVGTAYERDGGTWLYSEHHFCSIDQSQCQVFYFNTQGEAFARKQLYYGHMLQAPALHMSDFRHGREQHLQPPADQELVVDAGFDHYLRQHWDTLLAGERLHFPFLVAGRENALAMHAGLDRVESCDADWLCLQVKPDSWLLGVLVQPIELTYERASRRLIRFRGISNIKSAADRTQWVDIHYHYPQAD